MKPITFATAQADSTEGMMSAVCGYLSTELGVRMIAVDDIPWQERLREVGEGRVDIGWICGSYFTRLMAVNEPVVELLAAPVMAQSRYEGRPIYFSDVVVRRDSPFYQFDDLRGATFAVNEPGSMSGYWSMRHHLARLGEMAGFFGRKVHSGAHINSLRMVLAGEADTAAIDSMVMEAEVKDLPEMAANIRVVAVLGPTPIPPWVVRRELPRALRDKLRRALTTLHEEEAGRKLLAGCGMWGFSAVGEGHYDAVGEMMVKAAEVNW